MKRRSFSRLFEMLGPHWPSLMLAFAASFVDKVADSVLIALQIGAIIDAATAKSPELALLAAKNLMCVALIRVSLSPLSRYLASLSGARAAKRMRTAVLRSALGSTEEAASKVGSGDIVSVLVNDVEMAQGAYESLLVFVGQLLLIGLSLTTLFVWSWQMALTVVSLALACFAAAAVFAGPLRKIGRAYQTKLGAVSDLAANVLGGMAVVKSLQAEKPMKARFARGAEDHYHTAMRRGTLLGLQSLTLDLVPHACLAALMVVSGSMVFKGRITAGLAVALIQLSTRALFPFATLGHLWAGFQSNLAALDRVFAALEVEQESDCQRPAAGVVPDAPHLAFCGVSFGYGDKQVLEHFTVDVTQGATVALIGPSGSGKTTLLKLLLRLYKPDEGLILIDGRDIYSMPLPVVRDLVTLVPQEPWIFPGTVEANIALGRENATQEQIKEAAIAANAHDFIERLPQGYCTQLDERGSNLSGGEKQRICLARAFLKGDDIMLFDEPTSSVDGASERAIAEAIRLHSRKSTVVMASHNPTLLDVADKVVTVGD